MRLRRRVCDAGETDRAAARRTGDLLTLPVVCLHEEDEHEPEPVRKKPIISVNGKDVSVIGREVQPSPAGSPTGVPDRKLA